MATLSSPDRHAAANARQRRWQDGAFVALHCAGFVISTLLISWGLFAFFFLAIGGFSLDGLMHQLANVSRRYVAATPERVASFKAVVGVAHLIVTVGLVVLRRHHMFPTFDSQGDARHG
ncbi:hypothetical protein [Sphingobium yanoikuyae]|uniref:Uncharacterized protein n=1 Tax=Sphingobium yanoikuyae TaxID=13690 RepID=A0A291MZM3_SPHYA|nr:hypothetical protein [Sphingobium yanoikuyae]ATI80549.1 hypothetical protein A6768_11465 [Sphingobium yanoikuyae]